MRQNKKANPIIVMVILLLFIAIALTTLVFWWIGETKKEDTKAKEERRISDLPSLLNMAIRVRNVGTLSEEYANGTIVVKETEEHYHTATGLLKGGKEGEYTNISHLAHRDYKVIQLTDKYSVGSSKYINYGELINDYPKITTITKMGDLKIKGHRYIVELQTYNTSPLAGLWADNEFQKYTNTTIGPSLGGLAYNPVAKITQIAPYENLTLILDIQQNGSASSYGVDKYLLGENGRRILESSLPLMDEIYDTDGDGIPDYGIIVGVETEDNNTEENPIIIHQLSSNSPLDKLYKCPQDIVSQSINIKACWGMRAFSSIEGLRILRITIIGNKLKSDTTIIIKIYDVAIFLDIDAQIKYGVFNSRGYDLGSETFVAKIPIKLIKRGVE